MSEKKRIIIINWRWRIFKGGVNSNIFKDNDYQTHLNDIGKGLGLYFQEYLVEEDEHALVVALDIYKDDETTDALLKAVLSRYLLPENEVLLFFHRGHFYKESDLAALKAEMGNEGKYFLMADGRDYIYYPTQKGGLLDEDGDFYTQVDDDLGTFVRTYDKTSGRVMLQFFNRVWLFYRFAFQQKVFELKEILSAALLPFLMPNAPENIDIAALRAVIQNEDGLLWFRLENLAGLKPEHPSKLSDPRTRAYHESREKLEKLEKQLGKSYFFDDLLANIHASPEYEHFIAEAYRTVCEDLQMVLFEEGQQTTNKAALRNLISRFNELISRIPGELSV